MEKRGGTSACLLDALCNEMILPSIGEEEEEKAAMCDACEEFRLVSPTCVCMVLYTLA